MLLKFETWDHVITDHRTGDRFPRSYNYCTLIIERVLNVKLYNGAPYPNDTR